MSGTLQWHRLSDVVIIGEKQETETAPRRHGMRNSFGFAVAVIVSALLGTNAHAALRRRRARSMGGEA